MNVTRSFRRVGLRATGAALIAAAFVLARPALVRGQPAPGPEPRLGVTVLDQNSYFRQHTEFGLMRLNSRLLKSEGRKLLGNKLRGVERRVKRLLRNRGYDWKKTDWRDVARYHFPSIQTGDDSLTVSLMPTVPPPPDWAKIDFDDTAFLRQKIGIFTPVSPGWGIGRASSSFHRQGLYLRSYFEVPDPAQAGRLTLKAVYRGGVRVLVNGREVARGHLPAGEVTSDTFAEPYPLEAYLAEEDELWQRRKVAGPWIGDLRCPFDAAPTDWRITVPGFRHVYGGTIVNRKGWERLMALRDRVLGPIEVPASLLRKGPNVLAIELRSATYHPLVTLGGFTGDGCNSSAAWDHLRLVALELKSSSRSIPSGRRRPPGMHVWVDDMHNRLFSRDFNPPGWPVGRVRFVGAANGTFAVQVGLSTDKELRGLKASCGDLAGPGGRSIPHSAVGVNFMVGQGLTQISKLGWFRSISNLGGLCPMSHVALYRYSETPNPYAGLELPPADRGPELRAKREAILGDFLNRFKFFDHISPDAPASVPADTCQPLWLSLKVPPDAAGGKYQGSLTISADGPLTAAVKGGQKPVTIPVEAEIYPWRVPGPREFQTIVQSEQSPYGVAKAYKCELWSKRHFELMESSFRQLGRIGNDWVFVPVLLNSELGNRGDGGPIKWVRRRDGSLAFDYALLDRYLAIARKHMGKPKVVCFVIMHGCAGPTAVKVLDEATGKTEVVHVGPAQDATRKPLWRAFGSSLQAHMRKLGLEDAMYWGHAFDDTFDKRLVALMSSEVTPGVGWAAGAHGRKPDKVFRAVALAYGLDLPPRSVRGWKNPDICLLMPRTGGSIICVEGICTPFSWRVMCDRALVAGLNGLGRMGADYFDLTWFSGVRGGQWLMVGRPCVQTLWPGRSGVESGARNEAMLEGIQEVEARIFMEQALDRSAALTAGRGLLDEKLVREVEKVLTDHHQSTLHVAVSCVDYGTMDIHGDWQGRSRRLFRTAAKVARKVGMDVDRMVFGRRKVASYAGVLEGQVVESLAGSAVELPALGKTRLSLTLRNWTEKPRQFKAGADAA